MLLFYFGAFPNRRSFDILVGPAIDGGRSCRLYGQAILVGSEVTRG